jgi:flavodoxin
VFGIQRRRVCLRRTGDLDVDDEEDETVSDVNAAVIYYSATGSTYAMAQAAAEAAKKAGAEVRLRKVHELASQEAIANNEGWSAHARETQDVPEAALDDLEWADVLIFGTPTRYGLPTAQLKQFIDTSGPQHHGIAGGSERGRPVGDLLRDAAGRSTSTAPATAPTAVPTTAPKTPAARSTTWNTETSSYRKGADCGDVVPWLGRADRLSPAGPAPSDGG